MVHSWVEKIFSWVAGLFTPEVDKPVTSAQMYVIVQAMRPGETRSFVCDQKDHWFYDTDNFTFLRAQWVQSSVFVYGVTETTDESGRVVEVTLTKSSFMQGG